MLVVGYLNELGLIRFAVIETGENDRNMAYDGDDYITHFALTLSLKGVKNDYTV